MGDNFSEMMQDINPQIQEPWAGKIKKLKRLKEDFKSSQGEKTDYLQKKNIQNYSWLLKNSKVSDVIFSLLSENTLCEWGQNKRLSSLSKSKIKNKFLSNLSKNCLLPKTKRRVY